ncbi:MAG: hypothetical protein ACOZJX_09170 [Pseudomonadota bacterium]
MGLAIPELPQSIRASALMHGSNADFVINAYLALQRQWPDAGGYHHYLFLLGQPQCSRASVLREIAASDNARRCGVEFIDDLPPHHQFRPEDHDRSRLAELSLALRVGRTVADLEQLKSAVGRLTGDRLAEAVQAIVLAQQAHQSLLESRLDSLADAQRAAPAASAKEAGCEGAETRRWQQLAGRQIMIESELGEVKQSLQAIAAELAELRAGFCHLHAYATQDLKRQVADYVNALSSVQQAPSPSKAPASGRRPVLAPAITAGDIHVTHARADRG